MIKLKEIFVAFSKEMQQRNIRLEIDKLVWNNSSSCLTLERSDKGYILTIEEGPNIVSYGYNETFKALASLYEYIDKCDRNNSKKNPTVFDEYYNKNKPNTEEFDKCVDYMRKYYNDNIDDFYSFNITMNKDNYKYGNYYKIEPSIKGEYVLYELVLFGARELSRSFYLENVLCTLLPLIEKKNGKPIQRVPYGCWDE